MKTGLYFGTFNPIHVGHLIIANYMAYFTELDQVWFVVTPKNPFKEKQTLLEDYHRMALVRAAIENNPKLRASDVEFKLPKPSYTINTLTHLKEKHPEKDFALIMGEDNLRGFHKWKNADGILNGHELYIYPRIDKKSGLVNQPLDIKSHPKVHYCDAPVMRISASFIRKAIREKKDVRYLLTEPVYKYVTEMHFYEKQA